MMISSILALVLLFLASLTGFVLNDWRWKIASLAAQYLAAFVLVAESWPLGLAAVKWITAWIICALLAYTQLSLPGRRYRPALLPTGINFRLLAAALIILLDFAVAPTIPTWLSPVSQYQAIGSLLLIAMGLLGVGLSSRILDTIIGLLLIFAGFEIIYAAVEISTLVAGLLAVINLGIAMVGVYLILLPSLDTAE